MSIDDEVIIKRKKKSVKKGENQNNSSNKETNNSKKTNTETTYKKQKKIVGILVIAFSVLLFLSLISYSKLDESIAQFTAVDYLGLLSGDQMIQGQVAQVRNWLGLTGAALSYSIFNYMIGYAGLLIPFFLFQLGLYFYKNKPVPHKFIRLATIYLIAGIMLASLMGSFQHFSWGKEIPDELSGAIGFFLASIFSGFIKPVGSVIIFLAGLIITIIIGTDLENNKVLIFIRKLRAKISGQTESISSKIKNKTNGFMNDDKDEEISKIVDEKDSKEIKSEEIDTESNADDNSELNIGINNNDSKTDSQEEEPSLEYTINEVEGNIILPTEMKKKNENIIVESETIITEKDDEKEWEIELPKDKKVENIGNDINTIIEQNDTIEDTTTKEEPKHKPLIVTVEDTPALIVGSTPLQINVQDEEIDYKSPGFDLLNTSKEQVVIDDKELKINAQILRDKLATFKITIENMKVTPGPIVTLYEFTLAPGIKVSKVESLADDMVLALKAKQIRVMAPIPGKGTIGVEIPNSSRALIRFNDVVSTKAFKDSDAALPLGLGVGTNGQVYITDLAKMPHLLIAGATGAGKSVGMNTIICSILYKKHPSEVKFVIIDPKKVEMPQYSDISHLFLAKSPEVKSDIVTTPEDAILILNSLVVEMQSRYDILASVRVRGIGDYNKKIKNKELKNTDDIIHRFMPYIVVIIDELADLMLSASKEIEKPITRLAQMARAIGIHLVIATQRPSVDVITGLIKANFPARIAYAVKTGTDSRTILDMKGAEKLIGYGDMLCMPPGLSKPVRVQNAFIDTDEVENICRFFDHQLGYSSPYMLPSAEIGEEFDIEEREVSAVRDNLFDDAANLVVQHQQGSVSLIQRRLGIGYARAGRIVDQLEKAGIVGKFKGSKARDVIVKNLEDLSNYI